MRRAFFRLLDRHARERAGHPAIEDGRGRMISFDALPGVIERAANEIHGLGGRAVGLLADNGPAWVVTQLATLRDGIPMVPLPGFFTDDQLRHVVAAAGIDRILTDAPQRARALYTDGGRSRGWAAGLHAVAGNAGAPPVADDRVTFTSGTTGAPRGVRLRAADLLTVATSLTEATCMGPADRHLALLPGAILLEELGGLVRALLAGATVVVPPLAEVGVAGSSGFDPERALEAFRGQRATTSILMPAHLDALVRALEGTRRAAPSDLRFLGVGGAFSPPSLLERALAAALPVFEGWGLSEAASVIALNTERARRIGSVGRVLPHARVAVAADGELFVRGTLFQGYLDPDADAPAGGWWPTGDVGRVDDDGYIHLRGRKREVIVTAFGRNLSPEWVERHLVDGTHVAAAVVVGDGRPGPIALIEVADDPGAALAHAARVGRSLPDYARPVLVLPFERLPDTPPGSPRRTALAALLADEIDRALAHTGAAVATDLTPITKEQTWASTTS